MKLRKAFTLIELLVVIAIIALLLSILLPGLRVAKQQAGSAVCLTYNKQILTAWIMYTHNNDGVLCGPGTGTAAQPYHDWVEQPVELGDPGTSVREEIEGIKRGTLWPYYQNTELVHCPMDTRSIKPPTDGSNGDGGYRSYSFVVTVNQYLPPNFNAPQWVKPEQVFRRLSEIRSPGNYYAMVEENDNRGYNRGAWVMDHQTPAFVDPFGVFHNMRSILGYADGHAERQVWADKRTEQFSQRVANGGSFWSSPAEHDNNVDLIWLRDHYPKKKR